MGTSVVDRFHFLARAEQREKTPILAQAPDPKIADGVATLRLYDVLDSWGGPYGVSAKEFAEVIDALPDSTTEIRLHVNSPGGEVWEGLAILNMLRQHQARVVAVVDGIAASAASFVICGADETVMMANSELMVHSPWGLCVGNADDMAKMADDLAHEGKNLASIYAAKAGGSVDDWHAVMAAETWFSAEEAVAAGLADRIEATKPDDKPKARFDLSVFAYAGRAKAPAPQAPVSTAGGSVTPKEGGSAVAFSDEQITGLRQRLGVADDADEATILAALDEALSEHNEPPAVPPVSTPPPGTELIDATVLAELRTQAADGAAARAQQESERRGRLVNEAVSDGRITPAQRPAWLAKLEAEAESGEQVLAQLAKGLVPITALGTNDNADTTEDDALYASLYGEKKGA